MMARSELQCADAGPSRIGMDSLADSSDSDMDSVNPGRGKTVSAPMHLLVDEGTVGSRTRLGHPVVQQTGNGVGINRVRHGVHCGLGGKLLLNQARNYVNRRMFSVSVAVLATMLFSTSLAGAEAGQEPGLFAAAEPLPTTSVNRVSQTSPNSLTMRQRLVTIDLGQLAPSAAAPQLRVGSEPAAAIPSGQFEPDGKLRLNLFEDTVFMGIVERTAPTFSGGKSLSGRLVGVDGGTLTLVVNGEVVAGTVRTPEATYQIRPGENGLHTVSQIDPSRLPPLGEPIPRQPPGSYRNPARR